MSLTATCPQCQLRLNVPDEFAGRKVRCSGCNTVFEAPAPPAEVPMPAPPPPPAGMAPPDVPPPTPAWDALQGPGAPPPLPSPTRPADPNWDREDGYGQEPLEPGWGTVRTGLNLVRISIAATVILYAILFFANLATGLNRRGGAGADLLPGILGLILLGLQVLLLIGRWVCISVPQQSGVKGMMLGSAICYTLIYLVACAAGFALALSIAAPRRRGGGDFDDFAGFLAGAVIFYLLIIVLSIAAELLFLLSLRGIALFFGNQNLAQSVFNYIITGVCLFFGGIALGCLMGALGGAMGGRGGDAITGLILGAAMLIAAIVMLIWYLRILSQAGTTIELGLAHGRRRATPNPW